MPTGISVIICCYNSASRLEPTLKHLAAQKNLAPGVWEIIVVDNKSTDDTVQRASEIWANCAGEKPGFKVVHESTPGLSAARKTGISEAYFDYVLFCDDDNWLNDCYVFTALGIMKNNPSIGALGGMGTPVFEGKEPPFFWVNQYHTLAVGAQWKDEGDITDTRGVLYGAGMVLNKKAFNILIDRYNFNFLLSDRMGSSLVSSGDHELCLALKKIGYKIFFSEKIQFQHYIPVYRTEIRYYKKLYLEFGKAFALLQAYRIQETNSWNLKEDYRYICLRSIKNIALTQAKLFMKGYFFSRNKYKYLDQLHHLYNNIGIFTTIIRVKNLYKEQLSIHPLFKSCLHVNLSLLDHPHRK